MRLSVLLPDWKKGSPATWKGNEETTTITVDSKNMYPHTWRGAEGDAAELYMVSNWQL